MVVVGGGDVGVSVVPDFVGLWGDENGDVAHTGGGPPVVSDAQLQEHCDRKGGGDYKKPHRV